MKPSKPFTLRDLVALLCLAALGLPILAASLQGTVQQASAERCRTNLASLVRCVLVYTEQNRGFMPVYGHFFTNGYIRAPDNTYKAAVAFSNTAGLDPMTGLLRDVRGLGILYARGFARPPELFYCPSPLGDARAKLSYYPKPWGSQTGPGSMFIRTGYMWNPWVKQVPGGMSNQWTYEDGLALRRHPANWPLICDLAWSRYVLSHPEGSSAIWNMGYPDGHVAPLASQALYDLFVGGFDANGDWVPFNEQVRPNLLPPAGP